MKVTFRRVREEISVRNIAFESEVYLSAETVQSALDAAQTALGERGFEEAWAIIGDLRPDVGSSHLAEILTKYTAYCSVE